MYCTLIFENVGAIRSFLRVGLDAMEPPPDGVAAIESEKIPSHDWIYKI